MIPIRTDVPVRRTPWVNYALVAVNTLVFLVLNVALGQATAGQQLMERLSLWAEGPRWYQFLTSMFLHGDWLHLIGNMVFLWVFGNALNNKLGHAVYLLFYLACGLAGGVGFTLFESNPVVGASGAITGVAAGFAVLFPLSRVTLVYFFYFIGMFELNGLLVVAAFILMDAFALASGSASNTAYQAHLFGALYGFIIAMTLLATGAAERDQFDLLALFRRWRQRASYRSYMADEQNRLRATYGSVAQPPPIPGRSGPPLQAIPLPPTSAEAAQIAQLRADLAQAIRDGQARPAGQLFARLLALDSEQVLPAKQQVDLGTYLMSDGQYRLAAVAFESVVSHYPTLDQREHIELLLGVLYSRYLANPMRAKHYLEHALPKLRADNDRELAQRELAHVTALLGGR